MRITRIEVQAAAARIDGHVRRTPVLEVERGLFGGPAWLKLEMLQHGGSFKARGAFANLLAAVDGDVLDRRVGIVIASGGNAGLANAFAAAALGVPATVFVPVTAPEVKVAKLRGLGATVVQVGADYATAYDAALEHARHTGAFHCHAYDQPAVVAGAGTLALEMLEQCGDLDTILVAVGGGGLIGGVIAAVDGSATVVGVEPDGAPTLHEALRVGSPIDVSVDSIAADSLGARRIGGIAFEMARDANVRSVLVTDGDLVSARRTLWDRWRIAVEHGAAAAFAALAAGAYVPRAGERLGIVLCGANTDPSTLA